MMGITSNLAPTPLLDAYVICRQHECKIWSQFDTHMGGVPSLPQVLTKCKNNIVSFCMKKYISETISNVVCSTISIEAHIMIKQPIEDYTNSDSIELCSLDSHKHLTIMSTIYLWF